MERKEFITGLKNHLSNEYSLKIKSFYGNGDLRGFDFEKNGGKILDRNQLITEIQNFASTNNLEAKANENLAVSITIGKKSYSVSLDADEKGHVYFMNDLSKNFLN